MQRTGQLLQGSCSAVDDHVNHVNPGQLCPEDPSWDLLKKERYAQILGYQISIRRYPTDLSWYISTTHFYAKVNHCFICLRYWGPITWWYCHRALPQCSWLSDAITIDLGCSRLPWKGGYVWPYCCPWFVALVRSVSGGVGDLMALAFASCSL